MFCQFFFHETRESKNVFQASRNNEDKFKGIFEFHDDEERLQIEIKRHETTVCQNVGMKSNHVLSHQLPPLPKSSGIHARQEKRKNYFSHTDKKHDQTSSKKITPKLPVLQKDGTPARFSMRLMSKYQKDYVDMSSTKLGESRFQLSNNNKGKGTKYDYFFHDKHREINKAKNISSHQTLTKKDESAVVPKLRMLISPANVTKVKQRQQEINTDIILKKLAKTNKLFHEDELRICPQPWSNSSFSTKTRRKDLLQANVTLEDNTETACMVEMDSHEITANDDIPRSPLNYEEDLAVDTMEHCICSDDEDYGLLLKRYSLAHDENTKEGNNFTTIAIASPTQHDLVSIQNIKCTQSKVIMDCETIQIKERNIFSQQRKISSFTKNDYAIPKEYNYSDEQQCFREKGIMPKLEKKSSVDVEPETQGLANDSLTIGGIDEWPLQTIRRTATKFLCIEEDIDKFDKNESEKDSLDTSSDVSEENDGDEESDGFFCSQVTSETNAVLLQALMKIKATGSSPENIMNTDDVRTSPVMLSPESKSKKMHLSPGDLVTKRATRMKMKNELCDWSFLKDSKTLSSKDSDGDNSLFKEPLGVMFQDVTVDAFEDLNTPGKRRLITSAVAATPSNFESMFDAFDIFL